MAEGNLRIGVAGLGRMGSIFAARLLETGHAVSVWNRTRAKADALAGAGAKVHLTPAQLAESCDIVLVSLTDEPALEAVYGGPDGLLAADLNDRILMETSTVGPRLIRDLAERAAARGGVLVDAPILGTTGPAREGKLVVLLGGGGAAIARVGPVCAAIGRLTHHVGDTGTAAAMKLVVNMHLVTYWQSLAESMAMGARNGLTVPGMLRVLLDSPVATPALAAKAPLLTGETSDIGIDVNGVCEVIGNALTLARHSGVETPTADCAGRGFEGMRADGWADHDVAAIIRYAIEGGGR